MNEILSLLSLSRRAGKLATGFDYAIREASKGKAERIFVLVGVSDNTYKKLIKAAEQIGVPVQTLPVSMDAAEPYMGKRTAVLCVTEKHLESRINELAENTAKM